MQIDQLDSNWIGYCSKLYIYLKNKIIYNITKFNIFFSFKIT